jgi:nucleoside-diphosphate-sugar epimerase
MPDRVLVTGATGLLGREVVNAFENAGWDVAGTGLTRASPPKITKLDITDEQAVGSALDEFRYVDSLTAGRPPQMRGDDNAYPGLSLQA